MLRICQWLASIVQYTERSLLLLVTVASDLPLHTIKFCSLLLCSVQSSILAVSRCDKQDSLMRSSLCAKPTSTLTAINCCSVDCQLAITRDVKILCQKVSNSACVICKFCMPVLRILRNISTGYFYGKLSVTPVYYQSIVACWSTKLRVTSQLTLSLRLLKMHCDQRLASIQMSAGVSVAGTVVHFVILTVVSERVNKNQHNFRLFCAIQ